MSDYNNIDDEAIRELLAKLRAPVSPRPDFTDRVMAQVRLTEIDPPPGRSAIQAPMRPKRSYGRIGLYTVVSACITAAVVALWQYDGTSKPQPETLPQEYALSQPATASLRPVQRTTQERLVRFEIVAPDAQEVALAGSFNGWQLDATPLHRIDAQGTWMVEIPLTAGRYTYMFVIDRQKWVPDSRASQEINADFGEANSVITVSTEGAL